MTELIAPPPLDEPIDWHDSIAVTAIDDTRFRAHVDERWTSLNGVHGGVVAAIVVNAASTALRNDVVDAASQLRAATFGYVSGNVVGNLEVEIDTVRRGRSLSTLHARVTQDDTTTTVARLHFSTPWDGQEYSDVTEPPPLHEAAVRLELPGPFHLNNTETYVHPDTTLFAGGDRSEWVAWSRPLSGSTVDAAWLTMFGDYFPPAVFVRSTAPSRAVTIEYAIQIHSAAGSWTLADDEYLAARMHAFHSHDGFAVEDGWIQLPDGTLLASVRQTRLAG